MKHDKNCLDKRPHGYGNSCITGTANYVDSRTPEERANEPESVMTTTTALTPQSTLQEVIDKQNEIFEVKLHSVGLADIEIREGAWLVEINDVMNLLHARDLAIIEAVRGEIEGMKKENKDGEEYNNVNGLGQYNCALNDLLSALK